MVPAQRNKLQLYLILAGFPGILGLFLPFTMKITPWRALTLYFAWIMAGPAFLPLFITTAMILLWFKGSLPGVIKFLIYLLSAISAGFTLTFSSLWLMPLPDHASRNLHEWLMIIVPTVILISGAAMLVARIKQKDTETGPLLAAMFAYIANILMCLIFSYAGNDKPLTEGWQSGAWLSLFTLAVYLIQIFLFIRKREIA